MKTDFSFLRKAEFWKEVLIILVGIFTGAAAVYYFLIPGSLVLGSISGLAMVINLLLEQVGISLKVSTLVLIMNCLLIVLAYVCLGKEVGIKTVVASLLLGPFMDLCELIMPYQKLMEPGSSSVMGDPIFDLLAFVLLLGASQAVLFRINASTGGIDIIALIMKKYCHWEIGTSVFVSGMIVCCTAFVVNPFRLVVMGIIGTWFNGLVVDYFTSSLNKRKRVCIISPDHEQIRQFIINTLYRGCSMYEVKGGYTGETNIEIQALLTQSEFASLMEFIRKNDINAFTTAGNCSEVYGRWRPQKASRKD